MIAAMESTFDHNWSHIGKTIRHRFPHSITMSIKSYNIVVPCGNLTYFSAIFHTDRPHKVFLFSFQLLGAHGSDVHFNELKKKLLKDQLT